MHPLRLFGGERLLRFQLAKGFRREIADQAKDAAGASGKSAA
jgi:hypothetical protein